MKLSLYLINICFIFLAHIINPHGVHKSHISICSYPNHSCDNNTLCVSVEMLCDGKNDCLDKSDEGGKCGKLIHFFFV